MGEHGNRIFGAAMVLIGLLMLMGELVGGALRLFWPVALALIGAVVLFEYRRKRDDSGKVFTGTTLLLIAVFLFLVVTGVLGMKQHWPFFVAAPGIGLLAMARSDARRRDAMVPGWMAIAAAAVLYFFTLGLFVGLLEIVFELLGLVLKVVVPLGLIGLGAWMLFQQSQSKSKAEDVPEKVEPSPHWGGEPADEEGASGGAEDGEEGDAARAAAASGAAAGSAAEPGTPQSTADDESSATEPHGGATGGGTAESETADDEPRSSAAEPWVTPPAPGGEPHPPIEDADVEPAEEADHDGPRDEGSPEERHDDPDRHDDPEHEHDPERRD